MRYDRTRLRAAAAQRGDMRFDQVKDRLKISRATAHRLWNGHGEPKARTAAAVQREYGLSAADLIEQATA
ncbi:XRE family transcriptional regulator [Streptomyces salyersiae]|uniref:XRE family transcriptional regulator n=1 Tax=Streptomyces salyersiae TaxID=3075530 RepID=A0ABU2RW05_9ACTN|nr:XRE family transcriptional regulator [Streptomyces sp. DSM 41770]MDT0432767.1 XRE family transcriptional regulator [Streptomyces sp. DSM 41770]